MTQTSIFKLCLLSREMDQRMGDSKIHAKVNSWSPRVFKSLVGYDLASLHLSLSSIEENAFPKKQNSFQAHLWKSYIY